MYLFDFLGPFSPAQQILIYKDDPRIPMYEGSIAKFRYVDGKHFQVKMVEFSMNQLLIRVSHG